MDFLTLAKQRYSCRKLSDRKVDRKLLDQLIESAIAAPTAVNRQPFHIWLMESPEAKEKIRSVTKFTFGAEHFLVVGYREADAWVRKYDDHNFAAVDASIVATHIMMEIESLGLATTWVGHFDAPALHASCPEMEGYELIAIFPVGYADESPEAQPSARHFERKPVSELVSEL